MPSLIYYQQWLTFIDGFVDKKKKSVKPPHYCRDTAPPNPSENGIDVPLDIIISSDV